MLKTYDHGYQFKQGIRVIGYTTRNKDGEENYSAWKVVFNSDEFNRFAQTYCEVGRAEGKAFRIYATADERDEKSGLLNYRKEQLAADFGPNPLDFYSRNQDRLTSAFHQKNAAKTRYMMFDCDTPQEYVRVNTGIQYASKDTNPPTILLDYATKSGRHILTTGFNYRAFTDYAGEPTNQCLLWAYGD